MVKIKLNKSKWNKTYSGYCIIIYLKVLFKSICLDRCLVDVNVFSSSSEQHKTRRMSVNTSIPRLNPSL